MHYVVDLILLAIGIYAYGNLSRTNRELRERLALVEKKTESIEVDE